MDALKSSNRTGVLPVELNSTDWALESKSHPKEMDSKASSKLPIAHITFSSLAFSSPAPVSSSSLSDPPGSPLSTQLLFSKGSRIRALDSQVQPFSFHYPVFFHVSSLCCSLPEVPSTPPKYICALLWWNRELGFHCGTQVLDSFVAWMCNSNTGLHFPVSATSIDFPKPL